jgi:hypothetical protein
MTVTCLLYTHGTHYIRINFTLRLGFQMPGGRGFLVHIILEED